MTSQLEEQERIGNDESKECGFLLCKYRNLEHEVDLAREKLEEEHQAKADSQRQLNKAFSVVSLWRQKYEKDGLAKAEELEAARLKIQARLTEAQNII